ncbi:acetyltransferase [Synechococcus sp. AH-707-B22]|nr:acetyltransferase [Synechococcus sp. AH-707-B22]
MTALLILGSGGHARVLAETAHSMDCFAYIAFLDDRFEDFGDSSPVLGWPVLGPLSLASQPEVAQEFSSALVGIGHCSTRMHWLEQLTSLGYESPPLIHPTAFISRSAHIGPGSVVFAQSAVQAQARIGSGVILNTGCTVDHDVIIEDGAHICPGARLAGEVHIGKRSWIGLGACVIQQVRIGSDVTVGAGAAVIQDLPDGITAVGVPARIL